jgi:hypothetical protein
MDAVTALEDSQSSRGRTFTLSLTLGADVEEALAGVALNPAEADSWLRGATEQELMDLFGWYMLQVQDDQGEATASPS